VSNDIHIVSVGVPDHSAKGRFVGAHSRNIQLQVSAGTWGYRRGVGWTWLWLLPNYLRYNTIW